MQELETVEELLAKKKLLLVVNEAEVIDTKMLTSLLES